MRDYYTPIPRKGNLGTRPQSVAERFWKKVNKDAPGGCWLWTGATFDNGYGHLSEGGECKHRLLAHRVSYELHNGPIPDGLLVCHNCPDGDNPRCVNPDHLWFGTPADNNQDMRGKGRAWWQTRPRTEKVKPPPKVRVPARLLGEDNPRSKLKSDDIQAIRRRVSMGEHRPAIAREYGVTNEAIYAIVTRRVWTHLPD